MDYYVQDSLGTTRVMTDSSGNICYDADFDPSGGERAYVDSCPQNYKFEGKERNSETQDDDFGARYYTWRLGRWLSADWSSVPAPVPYANLTNPQTLNLYAMVSDNPETFADLDGHGEQGAALGGSYSMMDAAISEAAAGGDPGDGDLTEFDELTSALAAEFQLRQAVAQMLSAQQQGLTTQSQNAIGSAAARYHYDAKTFTAAVLAAAGKNGVDPNILVGLGYRESSLNPSAKNGGLFQIQDPSAYGIKAGDIGSFAAQLPAAAKVLSSNIKAFHGNVDLGIASWTLGVGGTRHLFSTGGMQAVRSAWLDRNHHDYGTVGPDYVDIIDKFEH